VIRVPGRAPARREDIASLLDVVPTLLQQIGLPAEELPGRDLLADGAVDHASEVLLSNHRPKEPRTGLVSGGYKYVADRATGELVEFVVRVDRVGAASLAAPEKLPAMRRRHRELDAAQRPVEARGQRLSEEELGHLRNLGYAE
jgi:arylsulfatase A-like enzyme